jgi:hypothetical protein
MNPALTQLARDLESAADPDKLFGGGQLPRHDQKAAVRAAYHSLARIAHPDAYLEAGEQDLAGRAFQALAALYARAEAQIAAGTYGAPASASPAVTLRTRTREYQVETIYRVEDIYNAYPCRYQRFGRSRSAVLRVVRDPRDNPLANNELRALGQLRRRRLASAFFPYLPHPLESFLYQEGGPTRQALILKAETGWYSLEEVRAAYPGGVDPKDMAWIWRRLLVVLGYAHKRGVLHQAVLPPGVWIQPELHGLQLRDWTRAIVQRCDPNPPRQPPAPGYENWYPEDSHRAASTRTDIALAARCMIYLLGGDTDTDSLPHTVPNPIKAFLRGSTLAGLGAPDDAWELKSEFDVLLGSLWGERKFHPFTMPTQYKPEEVHNG